MAKNNTSRQLPLFVGDGRITRVCRICQKAHLLASMKADKTKPSGRANICKPCHRELMAVRYRNDCDKIRAQNNARAAMMRPQKRAYDAKRQRVRYHKDRAENLARVNARRGAMRGATPQWANGFFVREVYRLAIERTRLTGIRWDVDHIVPVLSRLVCGLHCEQNLAVIPSTENKRKNNIRWPDMP